MKYLQLAATASQVVSIALALSVGRRSNNATALENADVKDYSAHNATALAKSNVEHDTTNVRESSNSNASEVAEMDTDRPLTGEHLAGFCYLRSKLAYLYKLSPLPSKFKGGRARCAVVSSSGALREHHHGADIDKHDVVIRFNTAPTRGYEKYVGSFTTYRVGWKFPRYNRDPVLRIHGSSTQAWKVRHASILRRLYPRAIQQGVTDDPTTGFYGMLLALTNCGSVDAYEMTPSKAAEYAGYSYYSSWSSRPGNATRNSWHGMIRAEHDLWRRLAYNPWGAQQTGKSKHPCFDCVRCPSGSSFFAHMSSELRSSLDELVELASPPPSESNNSGALDLDVIERF